MYLSPEKLAPHPMGPAEREYFGPIVDDVGYDRTKTAEVASPDLEPQVAVGAVCS